MITTFCPYPTARPAYQRDEGPRPRRFFGKSSPEGRSRLQSLVEFVSKYAANGGETAVRQRRGYRMESWTYADIARGANRAARELERRGIAKGDAVLLW